MRLHWTQINSTKIEVLSNFLELRIQQGWNCPHSHIVRMILIYAMWSCSWKPHFGETYTGEQRQTLLRAMQERFWVYNLSSLCCNWFAFITWKKKSNRQYANQWIWLCSQKTFIYKISQARFGLWTNLSVSETNMGNLARVSVNLNCQLDRLKKFPDMWKCLLCSGLTHCCSQLNVQSRGMA